MKSLLLASLISFDCSMRVVDIENESKVYNYRYESSELKELNIAENSYKCIEDFPSRVGVGIKTLNRRRCGPLTLFFQTYHKKCEYDDYNPAPNRFGGYEQGKQLLKIQHDCFKTGLVRVSAWHILRDKNGVEWKLEPQKTGPKSRAVCSDKARVETYQEHYRVEKTGEKIEFIRSNTYLIRSIKHAPTPFF
jgi:hypothetical protein